MDNILHGDATRQGASFIGKRAKDNPREVVLRLMEGFPNWSKDQLFTKFEESLTPALQQAVNWYFFVNMFDYERIMQQKNDVRISPPPKSNPTHQMNVERVKEQLVSIILLDLMLPSGKPLRDVTFKECQQAGGWFLKVAKLGKPNQIVGKVLSEEKLRAVK